MADNKTAVIAYDPAWPARFSDLGRHLRLELGDLAQRIDHIGSTAVPALAAKPVIDIQISVHSIEPVQRYRPAIERCGFVWREDNPDLSKRYFREAPGAPRTHIHVRRTGSFAEQFALLFRDFLRQHRDEAELYAADKRRHAHLLAGNREDYVRAKAPIVWAIMERASHWAQATGWEPGPSDA